MDSNRFDALTKSLVSRRTGLGLGLAGLLGLAADDADAKKKKPKKCKPKCTICKKCDKGKCKPKPNGAPCGAGKACAGGVCKAAPPPPPSCSDGVKNGDETGVDCGGPTCPRCPNGQGCVGRADCRSALCDLQSNTCQACGSSADCGTDGFGQCRCDTTFQGIKVCDKGEIPQPVASCTLCAAPNDCVRLGNGSDLYCARGCGS